MLYTPYIPHTPYAAASRLSPSRGGDLTDRLIAVAPPVVSWKDGEEGEEAASPVLAGLRQPRTVRPAICAGATGFHRLGAAQQALSSAVEACSRPYRDPETRPWRPGCSHCAAPPHRCCPAPSAGSRAHGAIAAGLLMLGTTLYHAASKHQRPCLPCAIRKTAVAKVVTNPAVSPPTPFLARPCRQRCLIHRLPARQPPARQPATGSSAESSHPPTSRVAPSPAPGGPLARPTPKLPQIGPRPQLLSGPRPRLPPVAAPDIDPLLPFF